MTRGHESLRKEARGGQFTYGESDVDALGDEISHAAKYQSLSGLRVEARRRLMSSRSPTSGALKLVTGNAECIAVQSGQASSAVPGGSVVCAAIWIAEFGSHWPWICAACAMPATVTSNMQRNAATRSPIDRGPAPSTRWDVRCMDDLR